MTDRRFYLITNDRRRAQLMLWCHAGNVPRSIAIVDDPWAYEKIPNGSECRCFWWGTPENVDGWKSIWLARVVQGGILAIDEADWQRILDWVEVSRRRPTLTLLYGMTFDDPIRVAPEPENDNAPVELSPAPASAAEPPAAPTARKSRWT